MHVCRRAAKFQRKGRRDNDFRRRGDVGELGIHLRTDVFEVDVVDWFPGLAVFGENDVEQTLDDALFGCSEVASFDTGVEAPVTAKHVVDDQEDQIWI